jgi:hypothetical protein
MASGATCLAAAAALLFGAAAGAAHAAEVPTIAPIAVGHSRSGSEFASDAPWVAPTAHKQLQWDSKGRWGLRLDMIQPTQRDPGLKDMQAGAFFRITPSLQVNGTVGLGENRLAAAQPQRVTPQDAAPQVHLETAFRF